MTATRHSVNEVSRDAAGSIQIVGRYRDEFGVLQLAHAFEQATKVGLRRPPVV